MQQSTLTRAALEALVQDLFLTTAGNFVAEDAALRPDRTVSSPLQRKSDPTERYGGVAFL